MIFKLIIKSKTLSVMMILIATTKLQLTQSTKLSRWKIACSMANSILRLLALSSVLLSCNSLLATELEQICQRSFNYSIYLSGLHIGEMNRTENWQGKTALITSQSEASILGIGTQYQQRSELTWSTTSNEWLTNNFQQRVSGFRTRDMGVTLDNNGLRSRVDIDGKVTTYQSDTIPPRDVDTLAMQIRENLLKGHLQFKLIRQASDGIEPYQFNVKDKIPITLEPWGEIQLIPVEQTGSEEVTYFFAPSMNYQLLVAHYHGLILQGAIELQTYVSTCETITES
jgi:hypothetical protein